MQQPHQHGPQCRHGHGHGNSHAGHSHGQNSVSAKQYFEKVNQMKTKNPQFYWMEILTGNIFNKYCQQKGWDFVRSLSCQVATMIVAQAEMMFTCEWLPFWIRPFVSGLFFPLMFLLFFNFNVIYGVASLDFTMLHLFSYLTILFYILTAVRTAGIVDVQEGMKKSKAAIKQREYLQNPGVTCQQCKILKIFRSFHCPICKVCVTKITRHSLAFGTCIGSANELLALGFFFCITVAQLLTLINFFNDTNYGLITNLMFYALNLYIFWISFVQTCTLFIMVIFCYNLKNLYFGVTEHQVRIWMMCQYLMKVPQRQFVNSVGKGFINNLSESVYALLGISGYQSQIIKINDDPMQQQIPISGNQQFKKLQQGRAYLVNWNKAFFYLVPQIPSHPYRDNIIAIMKRDQPRMIEMYKLQKKFKEEVIKESEGQGLNQFQIQQRVGMKMQQHMMRNAQNMMPQMPQPNPQQQKMIQMQMLTHMINQLQQKQPDVSEKLKQLLQNLKSDNASTMQVGIAMKQIQQQMMKKQMEAVMKQREEMERNRQSAQLHQQQQQLKKDEDEQQQLKNQQVPDEDL